MTQRRKIFEFCLGVGFLIGATLLVSAFVLVVWSFLMKLPRGYPLLGPLISFGLAAWYRSTHYSLDRSTFVTEVVVSAILGPILLLILMAVLVALARGIG